MTEQVLVSRDVLERLLDATFFSRFEHIDGGTKITIGDHKYAGFRDAEAALRAALTAPAPAEDMVGIVRGLMDALTAVEKYALPRLGLMDGHGLPDDLLEKHGPAIRAARAVLGALKAEKGEG